MRRSRLKLARIDQAHHQLAFIGVSAKSNDVMYRISVDAFSHFYLALVVFEEFNTPRSVDQMHQPCEMQSERR